MFNNNLQQEGYQNDMQIYRIPHPDNHNHNQHHKEQVIKAQILNLIGIHKINN